MLFGTIVFAIGNIASDFYSTDHKAVVIFVFAACFCGVVSAYIFNKYFKSYGIYLLGLNLGIICGIMVLSPVETIHMPVWAKYSFILMVGMILSIFAKKYEKTFKVQGSALIGAGLLMHGLGAYI